MKKIDFSIHKKRINDQLEKIKDSKKQIEYLEAYPAKIEIRNAIGKSFLDDGIIEKATEFTRKNLNIPKDYKPELMEDTERIIINTALKSPGGAITLFKRFYHHQRDDPLYSSLYFGKLSEPLLFLQDQIISRIDEIKKFYSSINQITASTVTTLNFLKRHWTASEDELNRQIKILVELNIINNSESVFDIQNESPVVEILCLLNYWKFKGFLKLKKFPFNSVCKYFTCNDGKYFKASALSKINSRYAQEGSFDINDTNCHTRFIFFSKKLSNQ